MSWVGCCSSPSLVYVKTSKRPEDGGDIPVGLKLGENGLCLVPGGLPALPGTIRHPEGATWHGEHMGLCCSRTGGSTMPLGRSLHAPWWSPHARWGAVSPCCAARMCVYKAPRCSRAARCPGKVMQVGPSSPGPRWV